MSKSQVSFENAEIGFRNFEGKEGPFNKAGDRNFVVFIDPEEAGMLEKDGWNIKYPKPRAVEDPSEEDTRKPYMQVSVGFNAYPPKIVLISGDRVTKIGEDEIDMLDWAEIKKVDLVVRPYEWAVNGNTGTKAYAKAIYVTIIEDEFADKYDI